MADDQLNETRFPMVTRMELGKQVPIPIEEVWDSICKILRIARAVTSPNGERYQESRMSFLAERMTDLEGVYFWYKRHPYGANLHEMFVPVKQSTEAVFNPPTAEKGTTR